MSETPEFVYYQIEPEEVEHRPATVHLVLGGQIVASADDRMCFGCRQPWPCPDAPQEATSD